jgi:hypothetical protein
MKKIIAMGFIALMAGTLGCTTLSSLSPSSSPDDKYKADQPPPIQKGDAGFSEIPKSKVKISDSRRSIPKEEINDENYLDQARRLENTMQNEGRAMSKVGR